jgi:hypothetical protein
VNQEAGHEIEVLPWEKIMKKTLRAAILFIPLVLISCDLAGVIFTMFFPPKTGAGFTFTIGAGGGTAYDPITDTSVSIPAGALAGDTAITCKGFSTAADFNAALPGTPEFVAGVRLEPDGQTFSSPITLSLPIDAGLGAMYQDTVPLFFWDAATSTWKWVADGTVDEDRTHLIAKVSHFSAYAALSYPNGQAVHDAFYGAFNSNPAGTVPGDSLISWWQAASNIAGRNHMINGECYKAVGVQSWVQWHIDVDNGGTITPYDNQSLTTWGKVISPVVSLDYYWDVSTKVGGVEKQNILDVLFTIYLEFDPDCEPPSPFQGTHSYSFTGDYYGIGAFNVDARGFFSFRGTATSSVDPTAMSAFGVSGSINSNSGVVYDNGGNPGVDGTVTTSGGSGTWTSTATADDGTVLNFSGTWTVTP